MFSRTLLCPVSKRRLALNGGSSAKPSVANASHSLNEIYTYRRSVSVARNMYNSQAQGNSR